jgi:hypothetical protein
MNKSVSGFHSQEGFYRLLKSQLRIRMGAFSGTRAVYGSKYFTICEGSHKVTSQSSSHSVSSHSMSTLCRVSRIML